jgi:hypothetical protein
MPIYQVDIEKSFLPAAGNTIYWTNVYHVSAADLASALLAGANIVTLEKTIHSTLTSFTKLRAQASAPAAPSGTVVPLTGTGARATATYMPLFNVFRIDFSVGSGRPSRKFIRGPLAIGDNSNGNVLPATVTTITTSYINPLVGLGNVCDPQGQGLVSGAVFPTVGMRQLRRGSKRKVTPVL